MKKSIWVTGLLLLATGCSTMNNTEGGALGGGIIGAGTGALVGAAVTRNPFGALIGAGIGGATGAATGALIGHSQDNAQQKAAQNFEQAKADAIYAAQHPRVSLDEIGALTRQGVRDDVIINHIAASGSTYMLSGEQLAWLHQVGVSDRVVAFMQSRPPVVMRPPVVYGPPPAPLPIGVGIGVAVPIR